MWTHQLQRYLPLNYDEKLPDFPSQIPKPHEQFYCSPVKVTFCRFLTSIERNEKHIDKREEKKEKQLLKFGKALQRTILLIKELQFYKKTG